MTTTINATRSARPGATKFDERRAELVESALQTLAELGYAHTSLRDIAQNSEFSHGVLHYYFADKAELITQCMQHYRDYCVCRYDLIVGRGTSPAAFADQFAEAVATTMREDSQMHRLWYDLQSQGMFEPSLQPFVDEINRSLEGMLGTIIARYGELAGTAATVSPATGYALFDGLFHQHLLQYVFGDVEAPDRLGTALVELLDLLIPA